VTQPPAICTAIDAAAFAAEWAPRLVRSARAKNPGTDIDTAWLCRLWGDAPPRCQVSGHPFTAERVEQAIVKHPFAPSLDQKEPGRGYRRTNVRVVCTIVNFAMNQWGDRYLREIVATMFREHPEFLLHEAETIWRAGLTARNDEARRACVLMDEASAAKQRRRIAGLKASLTKGRGALADAARKALESKRGHSPHSPVVA
jgi:hypothetical protein